MATIKLPWKSILACVCVFVLMLGFGLTANRELAESLRLAQQRSQELSATIKGLEATNSKLASQLDGLTGDYNSLRKDADGIRIDNIRLAGQNRELAKQLGDIRNANSRAIENAGRAFESAVSIGDQGQRIIGLIDAITIAINALKQ